MSPRNEARRVPARRPLLLRELNDKWGSLNDRVGRLWDGSVPQEYEAIADALYAAFRIARDLAPAQTYTGCPDHPNGAIDPTPPEGWGRCLLCNERRRKGRIVPPIDESKRLGYPVPDPPYTKQVLQQYMYHLNDLIFDISLTSPVAADAAFADQLHLAFIVARELSRPTSTSGCPRHPGAPLDHDAAGGPECLFCHGESQRAALADAPPILPRVRRGERRTLSRRYPRPLPPQPANEDG